MAPKYSAPRVWRRPYTSIYNDNYRYGNSLYSEAISDIERKYNEAIARTRFRSDRPDINLQSFSDSQLAGESMVQRQRALASAAAVQSSIDSDRYRSLSSTRAGHYSHDDNYSRNIQHSESFNSYQSSKALANIHSEIEESKLRRSRSASRRRRPDSAYESVSAFEDALLNRDDGHSKTFWMERCRELQTEIENVNQLLVDTEDKVKHETTVIKNKISQDVSDLVMAIDDQDRQISELTKLLKKQAKQVSDITLDLEASQRHYTDVAEILAQNQKRCQNLVHEVDEMRSSLDKVNA